MAISACSVVCRSSRVPRLRAEYAPLPRNVQQLLFCLSSVALTAPFPQVGLRAVSCAARAGSTGDDGRPPAACPAPALGPPRLGPKAHHSAGSACSQAPRCYCIVWQPRWIVGRGARAVAPWHSGGGTHPVYAAERGITLSSRKTLTTWTSSCPPSYKCRELQR